MLNRSVFSTVSPVRRKPAMPSPDSGARFEALYLRSFDRMQKRASTR